MAFPPPSSASYFAFCIFLTIMLSRGIIARPSESRVYYPEIDIPQYIMDETETMDDDMYSDIKRYPANSPTFMGKRQNIRDFLPPNYGDDEIGINLDDEIPHRIPTPLPFKNNHKLKNKKDHAEKKNIISEKNFYMHPCPFKLCTMGRKRNARYLH